MARFKKKARQQRRTIVFIDESGLSTRPTRVRTWALRGQTPILRETFNWKNLSLMGGLARWRFYFQIHKGSIKSPQVVEFLRHLQRHLPGKILILWDGAPIHRSLLVKHYIASTRKRIVLERLPAYAPELNPVEYMWGHLKAHEIANLLVTQAWELSFEATAALRRMRRRPSIIAACYTQSELWPLCHPIMRASIVELQKGRAAFNWAALTRARKYNFSVWRAIH